MRRCTIGHTNRRSKWMKLTPQHYKFLIKSRLMMMPFKMSNALKWMEYSCLINLLLKLSNSIWLWTTRIRSFSRFIQIGIKMCKPYTNLRKQVKIKSYLFTTESERLWWRNGHTQKQIIWWSQVTQQKNWTSIIKYIQEKQMS